MAKAFEPPPLDETYSHLGACLATDLARSGNITGANIVRALIFDVNAANRRLRELEATKTETISQGTANDGTN